jgi:hypothetical protein
VTDEHKAAGRLDRAKTCEGDRQWLLSNHDALQAAFEGEPKGPRRSEALS